MALQFRGRKELVVPVDPVLTDPPEFPKEYFDHNKIIPVNVDTTTDLEELRKAVISGLADCKLPVSNAAAFIYRIMKDVKVTLERDWTSFTVQIGIKGQSMSPMDILTATHVEAKLYGGRPNIALINVTDFSLCVYLCGLFRIGRYRVDTYRNDLMDHLLGQCKSVYSAFTVQVTANNDFYNHWSNDQTLCKICAAIDMFFHFNKKVQEAVIRWGTIVCRFRDCAATGTLGHVCQVTGMGVRELATWIMNETVAIEYATIMTPEQEYGNAYSFAPYLVDLGISRRSPYSAAVNPNLHFWGQLACYFLTSSRAKNARVLPNLEYSALIKSAMLLAFAVSRTPKLVTWYAPQGQKFTEDPDEFDAPGQMPKERHSGKWLAWFRGLDYEFTHEMEQFALTAVHHGGQGRPNSVAEFAMKHFAPELYQEPAQEGRQAQIAGHF
nr:MAG: nucleocapsid protein [Mononegavirales sp.]